MQGSDRFQHLQQTYFDECAELLDVLIDQIGTLVPDDRDTEKLNTIFRAVHSIKAGAGAFKFNRLVAFSHSFEAVLEKVRNASLSLQQDLIDLLTKSADILYDLVAAAQGGDDLEADHDGPILERLNHYCDPQGDSGGRPAAAQGEARGPFNIRFVPKDSLLQSGNEPLLLIDELARLGPLDVSADASALPSLDRFDPETCYLSWTLKLDADVSREDVLGVFEFAIDDCDLTVEGETAEGQQASGATAATGASPTVPDMFPNGEASPANRRPKTSSIRVDLQRVDRLVNMVGELVIAQSMVLQNITDRTANQELSQLRGLEDLTLRTRELQESVMAIRMQPVKSVFSRMPRVVRDLSETLGKKVTLRMRGEETEVDKTVIEELSDPLTHMIRNALDHGLEGPDERREKGKPETGTIELSAEHRGGRIVICVGDDGRGIDRERVRKKAVERGIVTEEAAQALSPSQIDQLVFAPGFSTAAAVSEISGRGVGMDVVRRNIQSLGGRITIDSALGQGTKFILTLPLTLAVLDGMVILLGTERFILPLTGIVECVRPQARDLRRLSSGVEVLSIRGAFIPLVYLGARLGVPGSAMKAEDALVVLVEMESGRRVGLIVDELIGQQQVVIKSLEENFHSIAGISGATILGDGRVALIIDVDAVSAGELAQTEMALRGGDGDDAPADESPIDPDAPAPTQTGEIAA